MLVYTQYLNHIIRILDLTIKKIKCYFAFILVLMLIVGIFSRNIIFFVGLMRKQLAGVREWEYSQCRFLLGQRTEVITTFPFSRFQVNFVGDFFLLTGISLTAVIPYPSNTRLIFFI